MIKSKIVYAEHKISGRLCHVSQVDSGLACDCVCLVCKKDLIAVKGITRQFYFRHNLTSTCSGAPESALHLTVKQIIADSSNIIIKKDEVIEYEHAQVEQDLDRLKRKADVKIFNKLNDVWYIEVVVSNPLSPEKLKHIQCANVNCLVIDLSDVPCDISYHGIEHIVLTSLNHRRVVNRKTSYPNQVSNPAGARL